MRQGLASTEHTDTAGSGELSVGGVSRLCLGGSVGPDGG